MSSKTPKTLEASLEETLWRSATALRSSMDSAEYKHVVLGLIFLKYVSDKFEKRRAELVQLVDDETSDYFMPTPEGKTETIDDPLEYTSEGVFWVPEGHRWADLRRAAKTAQIGELIDRAMEAIEADNPSLKGVLPKNFARRELTRETLGGLIDLFSNDALAEQEANDLDVLGRTFEYMLANFASAEGRLGGEYFTPKSVVQLMVEMLEPFSGRVYDPAMGSGGMFVQADRFVKAHGGKRDDISVFGQERNPTTWRLAKMNLALRGIEANLGPEWGDSFTNDLHPDLKADFVLANPPFNIKEWGADRLKSDVRWTYGIPPETNANMAWIQHMLHHLRSNGTMATVLANGSLTSEKGTEGEIRQSLVDEDRVECIIALPDKLFYTTPISVSIWFLTNDKRSSGDNSSSSRRDRSREYLFIDASQFGDMVTRTHRELTGDEIAKISDTYHAWRGEEGHAPYEDEAGFCRSVGLAEVKDHGYSLTPGRYVGLAETAGDDEPVDAKLARLATGLLAEFEERRGLQEQITNMLAQIAVGDGA